jgi:hypothetical protein
MSLESINKLSNYFDEIASKKPRISGGKNSPLVGLFKEAQVKIVEAALHCNKDKATKKSLNKLIRSMKRVNYSYTRLSGNPFVRMGLIKPRGMSEALSTAKAAIHRAEAAIGIIDDLKKGTSYNVEVPAFQRKEHLKALEGDDPQVLIKFLEASGPGGEFETCRGELEELAEEQFVKLVRKNSSYHESSAFVYEKGKWKAKRNKLGHAANEKSNVDQLLAYMPYVKFNVLKACMGYVDDWNIYRDNLWGIRDSRIRFISSVCQYGQPRTNLFQLRDVTPDLAKVLIRIARDSDNGRLLRDALLMEHFKDLTPESRKVGFEAFNGLLDPRHETRERWERGAFNEQDFKLLYEMKQNGFFDNRPLVIAAALANPTLDQIFSDEMPEHANLSTQAMWFVLQSMKSGLLEDKNEAALLFNRILALEQFETNQNTPLEEMGTHCRDVFNVYNTLAELKASESPLEEGLRKILPRTSSMEEQVIQPAEESEPFAVSALRYALEAPSENRVKLFEDLLSVVKWDKDYPMLDTLPPEFAQLASLNDTALAFLNAKFPYTVHVLRILQNKERQGLDLLPIDQQIDLHQNLRPVSRPDGSVPYEQRLLIDPNQGWNVSNQELCDSGRKLLDREDAGDVKIRVNGKERQVFSELIEGACPGKKIEFPTDFSSDELDAFLQFCYTGEIANPSDRVLFSLYAKAGSLGSDALKDYCFKRLISKTSLDNVLDFAKLAVEFHAGALLQHMVPDKGNFTNQQREELAQIAKSILEAPIEMPQVDPYTPNVFNLKALKDDFVLVGKNGIEIHANKLLLSLRSEYFAGRMRFPEGTTGNKATFDIDDMLLLKLVKIMKEGVLPEDLSKEDLAALNEAGEYFDIPLLGSKTGLNPAMTILPSDWAELGVEGIDDLQALELLPDNINEILAQPSPFHPEKTVGESFFLVCIPEGQTCDSLEKISKERLIPPPRGFSFHNLAKNHLQGTKTLPHWILIAPDVIPESLNKSSDEINEWLASKSSQATRYTSPQALDRMAASLMLAHKTRQPFMDNTSTFCVERVNNLNLVVGLFAGTGNNVFPHNTTLTKHADLGVTPVVILS